MGSPRMSLYERSTRGSWRGAYEDDEVYRTGDMVRDGPWTMVALRRTQDRPAPQPIGDPQLLWGGNPVSQGTALTNQVVAGLRWTIPSPGLFTVSYKIWYDQAPSTLLTYQAVRVANPGTAGEYSEIGPVISNSPGGTFPQWSTEFTVGYTPIRGGTVIDFFVVKTDKTGAAVTWSADWDYKRTNGTPDADSGEAWHQNNGKEIRFSRDDDNGTDQTANLASVKIGDDIDAGGITWTVDAITSTAAGYQFEVTPSTRASEAKYTFLFTLYGVANCKWEQTAGVWTGNPDVRGFKSENGYPSSPTLTDVGYGVDIRYNNAHISDDWDMVAYSA